MDDQHLREQLINALAKRQAHQLFDTVVNDFPAGHYNTRPTNLPYSFWCLLEHIRITQWDILDYIDNPDYQYLKFPDDYWSDPDLEADAERWNKTIGSIRADLLSLVDIVKDPARDLCAQIPHGKRDIQFCARFWLLPRTIRIILASSASCAALWISGNCRNQPTHLQIRSLNGIWKTAGNCNSDDTEFEATVFAMRDLYHDLASIQGSLAIDRRRDCAELPTPEDVSRLLPVCSDPQGTIPLMMLNCELQLAQVYRAVSFGGRQ